MLFRSQCTDDPGSVPCGRHRAFRTARATYVSYRGTDHRNGKSWASRLGKKGKIFRVRAPFFVSGDSPIPVPHPEPDPILAHRQVARVLSAETTGRFCRLLSGQVYPNRPAERNARPEKRGHTRPATRKHENGGGTLLAEHADPNVKSSLPQDDMEDFIPAHNGKAVPPERLRKYGRPTAYSALT